MGMMRRSIGDEDEDEEEEEEEEEDEEDRRGGWGREGKKKSNGIITHSHPKPFQNNSDRSETFQST